MRKTTSDTFPLQICCEKYDGGKNDAKGYDDWDGGKYDDRNLWQVS
jgi:hypothetical protein